MGAGGTIASSLAFFLFPHVWIGVGLAGYTVLTVLWLFFGADVSGRIVEHHTSVVKGKTNYTVTYGYRANGSWHQSDVTVPADDYVSLTAEPNHPVDVRFFALGPFERAELDGVRSPLGLTLAILCACGFWNGVMYLFLRQFVLVPRRRRLLVRDGFATVGLVTAQDNAGNFQGKFRVAYEYEDKSGQRRQGEMFLSVKAKAESVVRGQRVTVLHDLERPELSTIYELCGFTAAGRA